MGNGFPTTSDDVLALYFDSCEAEAPKKLTSGWEAVQSSQRPPKRSLISPNPARFNLGITQIPKFSFLFESSPVFLRIRRGSHRPTSKVLKFRPPGASVCSETLDLGGWEDLQLVDDPSQSAESALLRKFLAYLGINDKRFSLLFLLGFVCALSVSRVRVYSIVVIPAGVLLFEAGFSIGWIRGGRGGNRKGLKDARHGAEFGERLGKIAAKFDDVNARVIKLRSDIEEAIESNRVSSVDLERYAVEVDLIGCSASGGRDYVTDAGVSVGGGGDGVVRKDKEKKVWFWEFIGRRLGDEQAKTKVDKVKESMKVENVETRAKNPRTDDDGQTQASEEARARAYDYSERNDGKFYSVSSQDVVNEEIYDVRRQQRGTAENGGFSVDEMGDGDRRYADSEDFVFHRDRFEYSKSESVFVKGSRGYGGQSLVSRDDMIDFGEHAKTNVSFSRDRSIKKSTGRYTSQRSSVYANFSDDELEGGFGYRILDDMEFDKHLKEANVLFRQAKDSVRENYYDDNTDAMLNQSAGLLSKAIEMKPMSLLAVGQLGNTYLLHGEVKLRISRDLRNLLSIRDDDPLAQRRRRTMRNFSSKPSKNKDEIVARLIQACEECEELLVKAGRKYRLALSIDGDDIRALYNWGLALSFRAQLISDIGPESSADADKVFLAAINKFNAMLSRGNAYAPDALFRWGVVLQQRSRLQLRTNSEKAKLLKQAKRLYEDALDMDSENPRVREALSVCMVELNDDPL